MTSSLTPAQQNVLDFVREKLAAGEAPPTYREICDRFGYRSPKAASDHVAALERKGLLTRERRSARGLRLRSRTGGIRVLGYIPAGALSEPALDHAGTLDVDPKLYGIRNGNNAFAVRVTGDSMIDRHICNGDFVILEAHAKPSSGDIVAALIENQVTLKTYIADRNRAWLRAENPHFEPKLLPVIDLHVQGVARGVVRVI